MPALRLRPFGRVLTPIPRASFERALRFVEAVAQRGGDGAEAYEIALALGMSPGSSYFRTIQAAASKHGLIERERGRTKIRLTPRAFAIVRSSSEAEREHAMLAAALEPPAFKSLYQALVGRKLPAKDIVVRRLSEDLGMTTEEAVGCADTFFENMLFVNAIVDSPSGEILAPPTSRPSASSADRASSEALPAPTSGGIFVIDSAREENVDELLGILQGYGILYMRPDTNHAPRARITTTLIDAMQSCSAAIAILAPERASPGGAKYPSPNVMFELGLAAAQYRGRLLILKERSLDLPLDLTALPTIEYDEDALAALGPAILDRLVSLRYVALKSGGD